MESKMLIGELARRAGVTPRTVRHYQELGLLGNVEQESNGYHYYSDESLQRLYKINVLKKLGLSLEEIQSVIDLYFEETSMIKGKQKVLGILSKHLEETDRKMEALNQFRQEILNNMARIQLMIDEMSD
ncbi:DNA-binding transcriptional regulator, MerR family [Paenibacillus sophorae]|uniref:DNA-binding transcriptional regulator, MerR family n=1 Tax=Paenibacillus sophorae TaxID=1333845 RepID=A0A1H8KDQ1_9BACL|nr:MerR family transcriptional regulator [Paenibacillus sophorae]QWU13695.1 MerR family transcriptional regulator [Paenibacillus sophorae]SEN90548.1 DNA-binding transcriptional regulator, MerR family [Paenibacillus sophorae]